MTHKQCKTPGCTFNVAHPLSNYCQICINDRGRQRNTNDRTYRHGEPVKTPRDFDTPMKDCVKVTEREIQLEQQINELLNTLKQIATCYPSHDESACLADLAREAIKNHEAQTK